MLLLTLNTYCWHSTTDSKQLEASRCQRKARSRPPTEVTHMCGNMRRKRICFSEKIALFCGQELSELCVLVTAIIIAAVANKQTRQRTGEAQALVCDVTSDHVTRTVTYVLLSIVHAKLTACRIYWVLTGESSLLAMVCKKICKSYRTAQQIRRWSGDRLWQSINKNEMSDLSAQRWFVLQLEHDV